MLNKVEGVAGVKSDGDPWPFALGETIRLRWNNKPGLVVGRGEYVRKDCEFFVEYVNDAGDMMCGWFHESLLDRETTVQ